MSLRVIDLVELNRILSDHAKWRRGEGGSCANLRDANLRGANLYGADLYGADLRGADLRGADLGDANLYGADLYGADLYGADLRDANLRGANLYDANLRGADLRGADLYGADLGDANLYGADLRGADLCGADLRDANLRDANLRGADLYGADLYGANLGDAKGLHFQIPQQGSLVVYKKLQGGLIATLEIPPEARRTATPIGRKCRAEFALVIQIEDRDGNLVDDGKAKHNGMAYRTGEVARPDGYNDDIRKECTHGIHFFLTREEAEEYE